MIVTRWEDKKMPCVPKQPWTLLWKSKQHQPKPSKVYNVSNYRDGKFAELTELLLIEYSLLYIPFLLSASLTRKKHQTRNTLFLICENELYSTLQLPHPLLNFFFMSSTSTDAFFEVLNSLLVFSFNLSQEIDKILFVEQQRWMCVFARNVYNTYTTDANDREDGEEKGSEKKSST